MARLAVTGRHSTRACPRPGRQPMQPVDGLVQAPPSLSRRPTGSPFVPGSTRRDSKAARRFSQRATDSTGVSPVEVVTDRAPPIYPRVLDELWPAAWHHREQYAPAGPWKSSATSTSISTVEVYAK